MKWACPTGDQNDLNQQKSCITDSLTLGTGSGRLKPEEVSYWVSVK